MIVDPHTIRGKIQEAIVSEKAKVWRTINDDGFIYWNSCEC